MIRILVVDDHPIVRQGIVAALEDEADFRVVGAVGSADEALAEIRRVEAEVVLLDLELPGMSGVEAIPKLLAARPDVAVLVFTAYDSDERVMGALQSGARGYLLKGATSAEITGAIRTVAAGGSALAPRVATRVVNAIHSPRGAGLLTRREREVLQLVAGGLPNKQIATALAISERTVNFHVTSLLRKLDADNRAQAVAISARLGLLETG